MVAGYAGRRSNVNTIRESLRQHSSRTFVFVTLKMGGIDFDNADAQPLIDRCIEYIWDVKCV